MNNVGNCLSLTQADVTLVSSNFTGNTGRSVYLLKSELHLSGNITFDNNTADKGAALYIGEGIAVSIRNGSIIQFFKNSASFGGAIFVDLSNGCNFYRITFSTTGNTVVTFKENVAGNNYNGDSLYFSVSEHCVVNQNSSDHRSLMHIPYHFNYFQLNSTDCCDINCSHLNTKFPAITSP